MDYIEHALSEKCLPILSSAEDSLELDYSVLDESCTEIFDADKIFRIPDSELLLESLSHVLSQHEFQLPLVLSLSGGVDSMSMLVCLVRLKVPVIAVHIRHSSREEDTEKELVWVRWMCRELRVPLYHHHVLVSRPHGTTVTSIDRASFEEYTRQIRMGMYVKAKNLFLQREFGATYVLVGHHLDDVDENRIAELGKGNLIGINGMGVLAPSEMMLVQVRPWCLSIRKEHIFKFARSMNIPHMRNSTPEWSKRGWIRKILNNNDQTNIIQQLNHLGDMSLKIEHCLSMTSIKIDKINLIVGTQKLNFPSFSLSIRSLLAQLAPLMTDLDSLGRQATELGKEWNEKVLLATVIGTTCPIQPIRSEWPNSLSLLVSRVFEREFAQLRPVFKLEKFIPRSCISQLVDFVNDSSRSTFTWKVNRSDFFLIKLEQECFFLAESISASSKKQITANLAMGNAALVL